MLCASTRLLGAAAICFDVRLDDGYGSGRLPMRKCVDEDGRFVAVLQGVGQVEAANAEVDDAHLRGQIAIHEAAHDLNAKCVVAQKNVADAGDEDRWL